MSPPLRLLAHDADDLQVISAALQDAVVRLAEIVYAPLARTVTIPLTRFRWEAEAEERVQAAIQFGDVLAFKVRGMDPRARDAACSLLAIEFAPEAPPGGGVVLLFAGCGDLRLDVECIDAALIDISEPWVVAAKPQHEA